MDSVRVLATGLRFPEGPTFDDSGCLWCVEQEGEGLFCRDKDGSTMRVHTGGRPNGAVFRDGFIWFCDSGQQAIRRMNVDTKLIDTALSELDGKPLNMPNDLLFDTQGNLIFSCPGPPDDEQLGYVAVLDPRGHAEVITDGLMYPNGLALLNTSVPTLLIAETHRHRIWSGFWDPIGLSWETIRVWTVVTEAPAGEPIPGPDGMTLGPDGFIYTAVFGAGLIRVFSSEGEFVRDLHLPGANPTNCTFDPSGELGLIVTESERGELLSVQV
ncbi:SMP-30/gluconolactonase/LRE family protein [Spirosoma sp. 209]|uniref:SMP-30/gluconolactonase/LRE family protein n=1 Tax=Spirosoma sp. 209 TaxID=1955701 RepID=UPI00098D159B|nr:SMP-30/gluconolactonase/LRE family protein [Spirosoma sp. 209]